MIFSPTTACEKTEWWRGPCVVRYLLAELSVCLRCVFPVKMDCGHVSEYCSSLARMPVCLRVDVGKQTAKEQGCWLTERGELGTYDHDNQDIL